MSAKPFAILFILTSAAFFSCAPKAIVVEEPPTPTPPVEKPEEPIVPEPSAPGDPFRMPDMLAMPGNTDFRATSPTAPKTGTGAVIARPPTEPPSRPKTEN